MRKEFSRLMLEIGEKDKKLVVLVGDIGVFGLRNFWQKYPDRFYNIGISEQSIVGIAAGLSMTGLIPVIHSIAPFVTERCFEQVKNDFCYQNIGGNIISVGSAFDYAGLGCTHHTYSDIGLFRSLPNTEIIYPASSKELEILFKQTYNDGKLTYFRLPERKHTLKIDEGQIKFGKAIVIKPGKDITVIAAGPQIDNVNKANEILEDAGIDIEIIYVHTIKPLDKELIVKSALKTKKVLTIEEANIRGSLGDEVSMAIGHMGSVEQFRLGINDTFIDNYGTYDETCKRLGLDSDSIAEKIKEIVKK